MTHPRHARERAVKKSANSLAQFAMISDLSQFSYSSRHCEPKAKQSRGPRGCDSESIPATQRAGLLRSARNDGGVEILVFLHTLESGNPAAVWTRLREGDDGLPCPG